MELETVSFRIGFIGFVIGVAWSFFPGDRAIYIARGCLLFALSFGVVYYLKNRQL